MSVVYTLPVTEWRPSPGAEVRVQAAEALESGGVLSLNLPFVLSPAEQAFLRPDCVEAGTKSIKFSQASGRLWGAAEDSPLLEGMLRRYAEGAQALVHALFPAYVPALQDGNTSFRPVEAEGRAQSRRHDDRLLHVDAFPSRPTHGARLLRVFTNVHPAGKPRVWRVGEPFADVAARFMPNLRPPLAGSAMLLHWLKITKTRRSLYDHYMMRLHDSMKFDDAYQRTVPAETVHFMPGTTWIVFSDQVSHAAMSGQHLMEQTFMLPVAGMANPATSPLSVLEKMVGWELV